MSRLICLLAVLAGCAMATRMNKKGGDCLRLTAINKGLRDLYCEQPVFINFIQKNEVTELLDHVCVTFFPLPDDPNTFNVFLSRTYCDGSNEVVSFVGTDLEQGVVRLAKPDVTYTYTIFGYAGCSTDLIYRCRGFGFSDAEDPYVFGLSPECHAIGLSCLRKVEEIIEENCVPEVEFYVLPNKLPNRCVNQRQCYIPSVANQFYKNIGLPGPVHRL